MHLAAFIALGLLCSVAAAQNSIPGAHWGRDLFPAQEPEIRLTLSFDRFTAKNSDGESFSDLPSLDMTTGFNLATVSYSDYMLRNPNWTGHVHITGGFSNDEPSQFVQNEYLHGLRNLPTVPDQSSATIQRSESEFGAAGEMNYWFGDQFAFLHHTEPHDGLPNRVHKDYFAGAGIAASTLYQEPYLHLGGQWRILQFSDHHSFDARLLERVSWPVGGDAFPEVSSFTSVTQLSVEIVPSRVDSNAAFWRLFSNPKIGITATYDTGLFTRASGSAIDQWFFSFHLQWATGLRIETYNDMLGGTDYGPSFGFMIGFDLSTLGDTISGRF